MVEKSTTPEVQALILRSQAARESLGKSAELLRAKLDAPARIRASVRAHPTRWLVGATATGLAASRLLFRRPKPVRLQKPKSFLLFIFRIISTAAMPAVKIWLLAQIKSYLSRRYPGSQPPLSF